MLDPTQARDVSGFQVSGLGRREPGSGVQVRVQVQDLNFAPHPHLYLITRTRDLRAETWDLKLFLGRADHPWSAAVELGCSTLPKAEAFKIQVRDLNFAPHPYLYLITRTRDLMAET